MRWATFIDGGFCQSGSADSLRSLKGALGGVEENVRLVALLPGEQVAMRTLPAPPRQNAKLNSAACLLLEDELASPIEGQHIAILRGEQAAQVAAIDRNIIQTWRDGFSDAGLPLSVLTPDYACLNGAEEHGGLFIDKNRLIGNFGGQGFAAEPDIAKLVIADHLAARPDATFGVYSPKESAVFADNPRFERLGEAGDDDLLTLAARAIENDAAVNLLQGEFRPPRKKLVEASHWRRPAMLAAGLALLFLCGALADGWRASRIADRYASEAQRIHDEAFPDAGNVDIRAHARNILGSGAQGASFLALSDVVGRALESHENVAVDRVRYDQARGVYVFSIRSLSDSEIAAFRESLAGLGAASAETGGYRRSGQYWIGEMTVTL
jgi:type II secretion system protein L